ncbi:hypothetical protein BBK36DRAFT_1140803 [Trichoderma citrinoviride]|uniref:Uncharacterized protein n=1 Tax=Trichoderma citrinoviride TaxID=58853 RepID=A0A2T4BCI5_9HYPO|nr:hypothetical protein BBK36DRAFT_1140803 [Trichoderma citrinoviride]PTB67044.1 hypothetical protein BBK36DRAFT_1140803 [Trichoderma citrinoviride]
MSHPWWKTHDAQEEAIDNAFPSKSPSLFCAGPVPPFPHATEEEASESAAATLAIWRYTVAQPDRQRPCLLAPGADGGIAAVGPRICRYYYDFSSLLGACVCEWTPGDWRLEVPGWRYQYRSAAERGPAPPAAWLQHPLAGLRAVAVFGSGLPFQSLTFAPLPLSPRSRPWGDADPESESLPLRTAATALDWLRLRSAPALDIALEPRPLASRNLTPLPRLASPHPAHRLSTPRRQPEEQNKGPRRPFSRSRQLPHALLPLGSYRMSA